ncbi:MAG: FG-GAP repeat protein, partial [Methyloprofundus sp.]|nr:FG-GAP repeat protein [Methyloprofundus sp.]
DSGAVYIFEQTANAHSNDWRQTAKIMASDAQAGDRFGAGIAFVDDVLYIGAPLRGQGKVYIFTQNRESGRWQNEASVEPQDPQALGFGAAIDQDGQTLVIGAPYTDADNSQLADAKKRQPRFAISKGDTFDPGIESGALFVYKKVAGQWQATARLGDTNRESADHLGEAVAVEGDIIAASVKHKDVFDDLRAGVVYVYKNIGDKWLEESALIASNPNVGANFGSSFSLLDRHILVGANKVHEDGFNSGQAYLFTPDANNNGWELIHQQANADLKAHEQLGLSVALGAESMLIASKKAVYAFQNTAVDYYPAIYYPSSQTLQLNEVSLAGVGVLRASLQLSQVADTLLLTLSDYQLRQDIDSSDIQYSASTGHLTVPRLAVQQDNGKLVFYALVLQQIENSASIQFRV